MANRRKLGGAFISVSRSRRAPNWSQCNRKLTGGQLSFCLATGVLLFSLSAVAIAASSAQLWQPQVARVQPPTISLPQYELVSDLEQKQSQQQDSAQFAFVDKGQQQSAQDDTDENDEEVRQFIGKLMLARKLLDERLAHEVTEQQRHRHLAANSLDDLSLIRQNEARYRDDKQSIAADELLAKANRFAAEVQLAKQTDSLAINGDRNGDAAEVLDVKVTTNPVYHYSVSQEGQQEPEDASNGDFVGQMGAPLAAGQQQATKRHSSEVRARNTGEGRTARFSTLLEEEEEEEEKEAARRGEPKAKDEASRIETTTAFYGRVLHSEEEADASQQPAAANSEKGYISSMFERVYKQLAAYLPPSWTNSSAAASESSSHHKDHEPATTATTAPTPGGDALLGKQQQLQDDLIAPKGPEISISANTTKAAGGEGDRFGDAKHGVSVTPNESDRVGARPKWSGEKEDKSETVEEEPLDKIERVRVEKSHLDGTLKLGATEKRVHYEASDVLDLDQMWPQQRQQDSLLGKYVYAPTQHYYLGPLPSTLGGPPISSAAAQEELGAPSSQAAQHLRPGDQVYASQQQQRLEPAYAFQKQSGAFAPLMLTTSQLQSGKQPAPANNDLYFLVMVGAFCVMAMAVVLAAGLFAYRIQQNRKCSEAETEYPTYGVVGPNSMSGKCGAAALVGGYFANNHHQGGGGAFASHLATATKSGSSKHLPDLYSAPGSIGGAGSDSGLASLDNNRLCSNKKSPASAALADRQQPPSAAANNQDAARMYHYQNQKQQMIVSDRSSAGRHTSASDLDSEDENEDGGYTVYECPGLASAHEMEIKNPLFIERSP